MNNISSSDDITLKYINTFHLNGERVYYPSDSVFYSDNRSYKTICRLLGVVHSNSRGMMFLFRKRTIYSYPKDSDIQNNYVLLKQTDRNNYTISQLFEYRQDIGREVYERI
jgi:hypothetical protein